MESTTPTRGPGLSMRWVETTDEQGRSRLEMRWAVNAPEAAMPSTSAPAPMAPSKPPVAPHAA